MALNKAIDTHTNRQLKKSINVSNSAIVVQFDSDSVGAFVRDLNGVLSFNQPMWRDFFRNADANVKVDKNQTDSKAVELNFERTCLDNTTRNIKQTSRCPHVKGMVTWP